MRIWISIYDNNNVHKKNFNNNKLIMATRMTNNNDKTNSIYEHRITLDLILGKVWKLVGWFNKSRKKIRTCGLVRILMTHSKKTSLMESINWKLKQPETFRPRLTRSHLLEASCTGVGAEVVVICPCLSYQFSPRPMKKPAAPANELPQ